MTPWLTIIGVGDDGIAGLQPEALTRLRNARTVLGSKRVLENTLLPDAELRFWEDGYPDAMAWLMMRRGAATAVLASGDPMFFGIGSTLAVSLTADEFEVLPSPSSFSLAASRLKWPLQDVSCISLHGRPVERLVRDLAPSARILALTSSEVTIIEVARVLAQAGYDRSMVTVLEHLGGPQERITAMPLEGLTIKSFSDLNVLAIECEPLPDAVTIGSAPGLPDEAFEHDGQITKREVRAATLAALRPYPGALLWDIGAGSGSVAIEWMRAARGARAIALEENAARSAMINRNAKMFGVPELEIILGSAPETLMTLPAPDAVFIGGGISDRGVFEACFTALREGGILVANAVTVEGEARLIELANAHNGTLSRIAVSRAAPVGEFMAFKPLMPVTMLAIRKAKS